MPLESSQFRPLLHTAMLQSSVLSVPASLDTPRERQCFLSTADAQWRELAKDTEERSRGVRAWTWIPTKHTLFMTEGLNNNNKKVVFFLPEKALLLLTCCGLSGLLEEDVLPGSQPDSFSSAWGKEGKSILASELVRCGKCSLSYTGWFFPGKFGRPTPKGGVSRTELSAGQLVLRFGLSYEPRRQGGGYISNALLTCVLISNCSYISWHSYQQEYIFLSFLFLFNT